MYLKFKNNKKSRCIVHQGQTSFLTPSLFFDTNCHNLKNSLSATSFIHGRFYCCFLQKTKYVLCYINIDFSTTSRFVINQGDKNYLCMINKKSCVLHETHILVSTKNFFRQRSIKGFSTF